MKLFQRFTPKAETTRVLVVDDEASFTRMVKRNLEGTGKYVVETVNESPNATARADEFKPHIILLDVVMPEADGGDVASALRGHAATASTPILFVSAMVSPREASRGFYESGGEQFLAKPVSTEALVAAIEAVLTKSPEESSES